MLVETGMEWAERENLNCILSMSCSRWIIPITGLSPAGVWVKRIGPDEEHGQKAITEFLSGHKINVPYKSVVLFSNSSYLRLLEYQQDTNAMLIMIAGHDHSVAGRIFLGSNTDYLLHHVNIPIYVHKEP